MAAGPSGSDWSKHRDNCARGFTIPSLVGSTGTADHLAELAATQESAISGLQATITTLQTRVTVLGVSKATAAKSAYALRLGQSIYTSPRVRSSTIL